MGREVEIGMTLDAAGKFIVSVFDKNDPEHREKRRRYLKEKQGKEGDAAREEGALEGFYEEEEEKSAAFSGTEIVLVVCCVIFFALYVGSRVAFNDTELQNLINDEL